ncbi:MAG: 6-phosphogluconolactonase [Solirubrobacteraceae bacterium]|nr:6-phosphogluconolactonase [Solirubrobacteraceae bacterium]
MSSAELQVVDDPAAAAAERIVAAAAAGGHVVLTGGSTPGTAYELAAQAEVDWSGATLWFGDERCVPPDDERSNFGLAKRTLLDGLRGAAPRVERMEGERGHEAAARGYEEALRAELGEGTPSFDLLLLGLGPDGHCASLYPHSPQLEERAHLVVGVPEAKLEPFVPRVSMTLPLINAAHEVVFLVSGESKAEAVARAFGPGAQPDGATPSSLVRPASGSLTVLLDSEAAARL